MRQRRGTNEKNARTGFGRKMAKTTMDAAEDGGGWGGGSVTQTKLALEHRNN